MRRFVSTVLLAALACTIARSAGAADNDTSAPAATSPAQAAPAVNIGDVVAKFTFKDIRYLDRSLDDLAGKKAYVLVFTTLDCPVVQRYLPRVKELEAEYRDRDVQFVAVNVGPSDPLIEVAYQAVKADIPFPFVKDFSGDVVRATGVTRTPEVVVLDADRRLRYRGRIDSQYRTGGVQPSAGREDLKLAIDAVVGGSEVAVTETPVDGCKITFAAQPRLGTKVTYAEHIAPLMQKYCQECHRPGSTGPFALLNFDDVSAHAEMIAEVVREQRMPPCYSSVEQADQIVNRQALTDAERDLVWAWANSERPEGDASKTPPARTFNSSKWIIDEPDLVVQMPKAIKLPASGIIPYKYVFLPYKFSEDTWVRGVQILPGDAEAVHHCNLAAIKPGGGYNDAEFITGYVPGGDPFTTSKDEGYCIKKGSVLVLQIHYIATGSATADQTSVGIKYCDGEITRSVRHFRVTTGNFAITPGDPHHRVVASKTFQHDSTGIGMFSHMHVRGKDMVFNAHYPDGTSEVLCAVPNYSFDWQIAYRWEAGKKKFPKGTRIEVVAHYDNSKFNPYNPDPAATVKEGQQTFEEMMYGFLFFTEDDSNLRIVVDPKTGHVVTPESVATNGN